MLSLHKSALASTVSLVMVGTLGVAMAPSAQAATPDAATTAVATVFERLSTEFLPDVASSTALSRQLPTLAVTPAESVDLKTRVRCCPRDRRTAGGHRQPEHPRRAQGLHRRQHADRTGPSRPNDRGTRPSSWASPARSPVPPVSTSATRTARSACRAETASASPAPSPARSPSSTTQRPRRQSSREPSLTIATVADLPSGTTIPAGLGILGVSVKGDDGDSEADYHLESTVTTSWANPDNDAAGTLAFDNPTTAGADDGELAAAGAGTGIVTATQTGTLAGKLDAKPRANDRVAGLPSVGTTVTLSSSAAGATFEAPLVTAVVPVEAQPFLTMTPRDLAAGLSQAASAVLGMQNAKDGNLPLMRGSIANAVDAVGGIKLFLAKEVPDADTDDKTPGQPTFASLQDMLTALDAYGDGADVPKAFGWTIDVLGDPAVATDKDAARYDATSKKVNFTLRATRGVATPLELNVLGAATSGTATYSATGLSVTGGSATLATGTELAGRKVTSGASYGTIADRPDGDHADPHRRRLGGWSARQRLGVRRRGSRPQDRRPRVRRRPEDHDRDRHGQRRGLDRDGHAGRGAHPARWRWT